ncbi:MAG: glucosamine-6-phosphate deaminase [Mangrovibacterium sp.]
MEIRIAEDKYALGREAGKKAAVKIRAAIEKNNCANVILATGMSQFETLEQLVQEKDIDWGKVRMFHLDEYIGLPETSKASFRKYLRERFLDKVDPLPETYLINGEADDPKEECDCLGRIIQKYPIDVAFVGIGENGHLAFNDPPADFETVEPYLIVDLDLKCRQQQLGEGWFPTLEDVPRQAISMSIRQIMKAKSIVCAIPDRRKAQAVMECLTLPVSNMHPASILQEHADCSFYLEKESASLLGEFTDQRIKLS